MKRVLPVSAVIAATVLAILSACKPPPCTPTDPTCPSQAIPTYHVVLTQAPPNLGALVISFDGQSRPMSLSFEPIVRSAVRAGDATRVTWRAAIVGAIATGRLGTIVRDEAGGATPQAVVIEAAAGAAGGYATIPATQVRVEVTRAN